jgi:hypothetical protein
LWLISGGIILIGRMILMSIPVRVKRVNTIGKAPWIVTAVTYLIPCKGRTRNSISSIKSSCSLDTPLVQGLGDSGYLARELYCQDRRRGIGEKGRRIWLGPGAFQAHQPFAKADGNRAYEEADCFYEFTYAKQMD